MTSQMGSSVSPGRPGSAPAVRLAGRAVTSAILTYFDLIVTKGGAFAKGSCGAWLTRPAKGLPSGGSTISGVPSRRKTAGLRGHGGPSGPQRIRMLPDRPGRIAGEPARTIWLPGGKCHGTALRPPRWLHLVRRQARALGRRDPARAFPRAALRELRVRGRAGLRRRDLPLDRTFGAAEKIRRAARLRNPVFGRGEDRKSTRLNSSHMSISYAVFCLKK